MSLLNRGEIRKRYLRAGVTALLLLPAGIWAARFDYDRRGLAGLVILAVAAYIVDERFDQLAKISRRPRSVVRFIGFGAVVVVMLIYAWMLQFGFFAAIIGWIPILYLIDLYRSPLLDRIR